MRPKDETSPQRHRRSLPAAKRRAASIFSICGRKSKYRESACPARVVVARRSLDREQPHAVPQHAVVEQRRRGVQDDDVDRVGPQRAHEVRREVRLVPERAGAGTGVVDVDSDVDVAPAMRAPAGVRTEQIGLQDLRPRLQVSASGTPRATDRPVPVACLHHAASFRSEQGRVIAGAVAATAAQAVCVPPDRANREWIPVLAASASTRRHRDAF